MPGWRLALVAPLRPLYLAGVAAVAVLLAYEQSLVSADDLSQVKRAFDLNGYVGILYLLVLAACRSSRSTSSTTVKDDLTAALQVARLASPECSMRSHRATTCSITCSAPGSTDAGGSARSASLTGRER